MFPSICLFSASQHKETKLDYILQILRMANSTQTIYTDATIITLNSSRDIILNGFIIVTDSRITAIGSISSLPDALRTNIQTTSLQGRIVIPGLINTHAHLAQSILRGLAEDLPLHNWLCDSIWPLESCYEGDDGYVAARLTCAEMLKSGTTCFLEAMCTHRAGFEGVVKAVGESGIRGCIVSSQSNLLSFRVCVNMFSG